MEVASMANLTRLAMASALAVLLSSVPPLAQESLGEGGAWDTDGDGLLSYEEFEEGFALRIDFREWDLDGDSLLSEDEFLDAIYTRYDLNETQAFEDGEYGALERDFAEGGLWRRIGGDLIEEEADPEKEGLGQEGAIVDEGENVFLLRPWDIDGDGVLLRNEFEEGLRGWGTFAEFDADLNGFIRPEEFAASVFFRYDADGAGFLEEPELSDIGDDMGDDGFWDM
jgi:Ca2+-binding EF-hand superfamily protein